MSVTRSRRAHSLLSVTISQRSCNLLSLTKSRRACNLLLSLTESRGREGAAGEKEVELLEALVASRQREVDLDPQNPNPVLPFLHPKSYDLNSSCMQKPSGAIPCSPLEPFRVFGAFCQLIKGRNSQGMVDSFKPPPNFICINFQSTNLVSIKITTRLL